MSHLNPDDEVHPRSGVFIVGEAVARFAMELEAGGFRLDPPDRDGPGLDLPFISRGDKALERAKAAVRRFVAEREEMGRL